MTDRPAGPAAGAAPRRFSWHRLVVVLHRDIGYLAAGLTIIYAISGVAVNHVHHWNPSYRIERVERTFPPIAPDAGRDAIVAHVRAALGVTGAFKDAFRPSPGRVQLFYEGTTVDADIVAGRATLEQADERPVLRDANFLHLNHPKGVWTIVADVYAAALAFLAVTGMFVLRGRKGLAGRGKWLVGIGVAVPVLALLVLRWL
jgi:hypothetical protein